MKDALPEGTALSADFRINTSGIRKAFAEAVAHIHEKGRFTPKMMRDSELQTLVNEIHSVLYGAVDFYTGDDLPEDTAEEMKSATYDFSGFKAFHEINEAAGQLYNERGEMLPLGKFREAVKGIDERYNENYLRTEYNLFANSALAAEKWNTYSDSDRYMLRYTTAGDDKVREEHARLDGTTLPKDDPFWQMYYPPNGYGCRCDVVQVRTSKYGKSDSEAAIRTGNRMTEGKKSIFRFNPGLTKTPFPPKHPYMPSGCGNCDRRTSLKLEYNPKKESCRVCKQITESRHHEITHHLHTTATGRKVTYYDGEEKAVDFEERRAIAISLAEMLDVDVVLTPCVHVNNPAYKRIYGKAPYANKCPDLKVGDYFYEVEGFQNDTTKKNAKRHVNNMLNHGLKQSDRIIIRDPGLSDEYIANRAKGKRELGIRVTEVWIYDTDMNLRKLDI